MENISRPIILDCTLRDGGLVNDSNFSDDFARDVFDACADASVNIVEVGFRDSARVFDKLKFGKLRFCDDDDVENIFAISKRQKRPLISELADAGKCDWRDFPKKKDSPADIIRCAFYEKDKSEAADIVNACADNGFSTALCMMAASTLDPKTLDAALKFLTQTRADAIYLMDSFGALVPSRTAELAKIYAKHIHGVGKLFGIHCHNNLQCAFANTLTALDNGADIADCTIAGLGKGAGNCPTELLCASLAMPIRKILEVRNARVKPLAGNYRWGFDVPYMFTGLKNLNPRDAIEFEKFDNSSERNDSNFYDSICK